MKILDIRVWQIVFELDNKYCLRLNLELINGFSLKR